MRRKDLIAIALLLCSGVAAAQSSQVGAATVRQKVWSNQTSAGPSATFTNIGNMAHYLQYCTASTTAVSIELEGSYDGANWFALNAPSTALGCAVIEAGGYYPNVRANLLSITGGSVVAWYSAASFPIEGGGIAIGGKSPKPVTVTSTTGSVIQSQVWTTQTTVLNAVGTVYGLFVENTSAVKVYVVVSEDGTVANSHILYSIPATSGLWANLPTGGVAFNTAIKVGCTTSLSAPADPATGCTVNIQWAQVAVVNTQISNAGTVTGTAARRQF